MINFESICFQRIFSRLDIAQAGLLLPKGQSVALQWLCSRCSKIWKISRRRRLSHSDNMPLLPDNMGLLRNKGMLLYERCPIAQQKW